MATLTGINGARYDGGGAVYRDGGVKALVGEKDKPGGLDQSQADSLLTRLGNDLNGKSGVVRLVNMNHHNSQMKFKTAGTFKQMWLNGGKLQSAGGAIRDLLRNAGAKQWQLDKFDLYLRQRGTAGVEASRLRQEIATLHRVVNGSVEGSAGQALASLGLGDIELGSELGKGAHGKVSELRINGEMYVYKEAIAAEEDLGTLHVANASPQASPQSSPQSSPPTASSAQREDEVQPHPVPDSGLHANAKLERAGLGVAAYVKSDIPQVIVPSVYVIRESNPDLPGERFHAVRGGAELKQWAKTQNPKSSYVVHGTIMPKAGGDELISYPPGGRPHCSVPQKDLKSLAASGLKAMQKMSEHGFIHGDIKPNNIFWDPKQKEVKFIDFDGAQKISGKRGGAQVPQAFGTLTYNYAYPLKRMPYARVGAGRDLYAFGMSMLETAAMANKDGDAYRTFIALKNLTKEMVKPEQKSSDPLGDLIKQSKELWKKLKAAKFPRDSVEDLGVQAMMVALKSEDTRRVNQTTGYNRWSPEAADHPLNQLASHPALAGLMR